jgi:hypothetical protein
MLKLIRQPVLKERIDFKRVADSNLSRRRIWVFPAQILGIYLNPSQVAASAANKVIIRTTRGETIDGVFRGATETEVSVEIAGQTIRLPVSTVKSISFGEKLEQPSDVGRSLTGDAFRALKELQVATEIGLTRLQYSERLQQSLPPALAFMRDKESGWEDAKLAIRLAVDGYQSAVEFWSSLALSRPWERAREWTDYAQVLVETDSPNHKEDGEETLLKLATDVSGRLGVGDRSMSRETDKSSAGAFNDVYRLEIFEAGRLVVTLTAQPCNPHLTLLDSSGRKLEGDMGVGVVSPQSTIKRQINGPGTYFVWAGASRIGEVGRYKLRAEMTR